MHDNIKIIKPSGILDGDKAAEFRQEISQNLEDNIKIFLLDLQEVTFMDSSGLGVLVMLLKSVRSANAEIFLCSLNDQVKMLFQLTSMDRVFKIFADREEFQAKYD